MSASGLNAIRRRLGSSIRYLLIALFLLGVVVAAFAAGIGIYAAAPVWSPLLLAWWPGVLSGAAIIVALGAWWLWWRLPKWQVERLRLAIRDPKARADVEDNIRKTVGQLLGGAAVLLGAAFAYLQFQQQQETTRLQGQQQQQAAHDLLISNQVAKGFELLGNKDNQIQQRLGGIYALEGVMNTSKEYYQPVLEALCAFIRDRAAEASEGATGSDIQAVNVRAVASDIRAALDVIGRRALLGEAVPDLSGVRFPKADLIGANLIRADLRGADLRGANLFGATLNRAHLNRAHLNDATLSDADLSDAHLNHATLSGADLSDADLSDADLLFADLVGANLSGANLSGADLRGARFLTQQQLNQACGDTNTKLDPGLTIKPCP